jgi:hypothetical protein
MNYFEDYLVISPMVYPQETFQLVYFANLQPVAIFRRKTAAFEVPRQILIPRLAIYFDEAIPPYLLRISPGKA